MNNIHYIKDNKVFEIIKEKHIVSWDIDHLIRYDWEISSFKRTKNWLKRNYPELMI